MLERVRIERFKSITDATLDLSRVNVLVGPNNAGKSSVLQAVQFAVSVAQSLQLDGTATWRSGVLAGSLATQQLIYTPLRDVQALAAGGALRQGESSAITVSFVVDDGTEAAVTVKRGKNRNIAIKILGQQLGEQLALVETPFSVVSPGLAGIPAYEEFRSPGMVRRAAARGDANSVFRNVLWTLRQDPPGWREFSESLRRVFHDIDIEVEFNEQTDEFINATITREGLTLPIDAAGTGVLQAIQVLSYISVYKPKLLILDEPDSHLHPDNQRKLMRLIASEAEDRDFQVIMSSHSRHIIDETGSLGATLLWFSDGQIRPGTFDQVASLIELGALDAGDRLRAGATQMVLLTEDENTAGLRHIVESSGFSTGEYEIWSYKGCSNVKAASALAAFVASQSPATTVVVHRDRDYLDPSEVASYEDDIRAGGAIPFITVGTDIESQYLQMQHLLVVYPEIGEEEMADLLSAATSDVRDQSIKNLINARVEFGAAQRRVGLTPPSPGSVAAAAPADFDSDPSRYRHGKRTLKALQTRIQASHSLNRHVVRASSFLATEPFTSI